LGDKILPIVMRKGEVRELRFWFIKFHE
jgi:hypothetical protein